MTAWKPTAGEGLRGTADNLLDIIDIVQNDTALNMAAGGNGAAGHTGGFAEMPGGLTGTVHAIPGQPGADQFLGRVPVRSQHHQCAIDRDPERDGDRRARR